MALTNSTSVSYQQAVNQANQQLVQCTNVNNSLNGIYTTNGVYGGGYVGTTGIGIGSGVSIPPYYQPSIQTGVISYINFMDAMGNAYTIAVDSGDMHTLLAISQKNQMMHGYPTPNVAIPSHKMVEGDFSFDEMEMAQEIIEKLANGVESCNP